MNNDGWQSAGAGQNDRMVAGKDLQHYTNPRGADENAKGYTREVRPLWNAGGPVKEHLDQEEARHKESNKLRMEHLKR